MYRFTEAVCIINGEPQRTGYHNRRFNATRGRFFPGSKELDLREALRRAGVPEKTLSSPERAGSSESAASGKWKCRIEYGETIVAISTVPYTPRKINSIRLVGDDSINYSYKYVDRERLRRLSLRGGDADAVIIVKNGHLTDTTFSNIALFDGKDWIVPDTCLLHGTMRQYLLDSGKVREAPVKPRDLRDYEFISLINAMLDLGETVIPAAGVSGFDNFT